MEKPINEETIIFHEKMAEINNRFLEMVSLFHSENQNEEVMEQSVDTLYHIFDTGNQTSSTKKRG